MNNKDKDASMEQSDISKREEEVLTFWEEQSIFNKSVEGAAAREGYKGEFVFYDGPPFATGTPHYGHLLQSAVKDAVPRYQTMRGYQVRRQWGWDCHGLPIENIVEKNLGTKSKKDIIELGVKKFNDACREQIFTYASEWEKFIPRFGRWADMKHPYRTMDMSYMESEWWAFKTLHSKGLIYEDYRTMHICPRCETTLSQSEVTEGYTTVKDLAVTAKFKLKNPEKIGLSGDVYILAWTTTPWTLPGNVALAVGKDIEYVVLEAKNEVPKYNVRKSDLLIVSANYEKDLIAYFQKEDPEVATQFAQLKSFKGEELRGLAYEPLFDFYSQDPSLKNYENGWKVYTGEFVTVEAGTGVVHIAPAFGSDDMALSKLENLPFVQHVGMDGVYRKETGEWVGKSVTPRYNDSVKDPRKIDVEIKEFLKTKGQLFADAKYEHEYPLCWRCDTPLLNYATSSWFVAVEKIKAELLLNAKSISWTPKHFKEGRWGQWLAGARDWSISRQRFWANTIPVWRCEQCRKDTVVGSAAELSSLSGTQVTDLHKDVVDEITFPCSHCTEGGTMKRVPDVLDTWFDSGSAPYATSHYMGEAGGPTIPADFIGEAQDQVSKWFYYQHVLSVGLFGKNAFKQVVGTGIVLAADGRKMSKRLKNYPDPMEIIEKYGADSMRYYLLSASIMRGENLNFDEVGVAEISRKIIGRVVNVYEFYAMYANGNLEPNTQSLASEATKGGKTGLAALERTLLSVYEQGDGKNLHILDRWIIARLNEMVKEVTEGMEAYELDRAARPLNDFVDDLSTWYLRRSRDRFKGEDVVDKQAALVTLGFVLREFAKVAAPFMPFIADWLWWQLKSAGDAESVHLAQWPDVKDVDTDLIVAMKEAREVVTQALMVRNKTNIKVRQPLLRLTMSSTQYTKVSAVEGKELSQIIADEVNVKEVVFEPINEPVMLDTTLTPQLIAEGQVRDLIRAVQDLRKKADLKPGVKVTLNVSTTSADIKPLIESQATEISRVASLSSIEFADNSEGEPLKMGDVEVRLNIK